MIYSICTGTGTYIILIPGSGNIPGTVQYTVQWDWTTMSKKVIGTHFINFDDITYLKRAFPNGESDFLLVRASF